MSNLTQFFPGGATPLPYISGQFYMLPMPKPVTQSSGTLTANVLFAVPFLCRITRTFDRIGMYNTSAAETGRNARLGIYNVTSPTNGYPGSLLLDAGVVTTTAAAAQLNATISQQLTANTWYWLAALPDTNIATSRFAGDLAGSQIFNQDINWPFFSTTVVSVDGTTTGSISVAQAYGALPSTFTAGAALTTHNWLFSLRAA